MCGTTQGTPVAATCSTDRRDLLFVISIVLVSVVGITVREEHVPVVNVVNVS